MPLPQPSAPTPFQLRVIAALKRKLVEDAVCPFCSNSKWGVQPGVYRIRQYVKTSSGESSGDALPSAALVCMVCGNTHFMNLIVLGDAGDDFKEFF
jgi:hypothetical protein